MTTSAAGARRIRPVRIATNDVLVSHGTGGVVYLQSPQELGPYPLRLTDALDEWAERAPDRTYLAQRTESGAWRTVTYANARTRVRHIAQALLDRGLSQERPILILSGNGIDHGLLALAAMYVGVIYAPIAPAYSLQARDYAALRLVFERMQPALVFAADGAAFERALGEVLPGGVELVTSTPPNQLRSTPFADLEATPITSRVDEAKARVDGDTIAKVLFTSGSTGRPKGVINTQRMLCANQIMMRTAMPFLGDDPPVICDWSPWNHTAGGNHNFGLVLLNGGTFYIDEGKPTPALFATTLRNLREVSCTAHFAVPRLYEMLMPHLQSDPVLRTTFFSHLKLLFYAAAGLGQKFWDELREIAIHECGEEILIMTGFGATETAPFAVSTDARGAFSSMVGLPASGMEMKLVPAGSKLEGRVRGPNVTPGYWHDDALTTAAFDEEGFYRTGDAFRFVDGVDPRSGLIFDGRLAEDFKLSTGTWVSVGPLRARIIQQAAGLVQDVVIAAPDRDYASALIFPNLVKCRAAASLAVDAPASTVIAHPAVRSAFQAALDELARQSTGSSTFVARALLLEDPPSLDAREITDKGSINQKAVLQHRAALVADLYADSPHSGVFLCQSR
ncbi:MAG TPA: feruloyl-CoA synthase [Vicinamibacterales bacterium]|jgi:feruloyl-CoA synthase